MIIRQAQEADLPQLMDIYNYEVINGVSTLDLEPRTYEDRKQWFDQHNINHHPLIVAQVDGHITGYASLSSYREKEAYRSTVELSIYIAPADRHKKVATILMEKILEMAKEDDTLHTVVSVITSGNEASTKLHEKFGFTFCGTIREVGMKFGKYQDIDNYRLGV